MKKKVLDFVLVFTLIASIFSNLTVVSAKTTNLPNWKKSELKSLVDLGIMNSELSKLPNKNITRQEFCDIIIKSYEKMSEEEVVGRKSFKDTKNVNVEKAAYLGIVSGISNTEFKPNNELTREEVAVILSKFIDKLGLNLNNSISIETFKDDNSFSIWSKKSIYKIASMGIMKGVGDNKFDAKSKYTVNQSAITIAKVYNEFCKSKLNSEDVTNKIKSLSEEYYEGRSWTNENSGSFNGGIFSEGMGCAGFAFIVSDSIFGTLPARSHTNYDDIKVGDIIRINNDTHSIVVLDIKNDVYEFTEGNYGKKIHWGRTMTLSEIKQKADYVLTRYP
mgnify:CR=1 FL=1